MSTGNKIINEVGKYFFMRSTDNSNSNWNKARELAEKQGELEEFKRKKDEWIDYMNDEMFSADNI